MALTNKDASVILGMSARGDNKHDIAAWFGVNQARVAEVEAGQYGVAAAPVAELFPKGTPGPKGRRLRGKVKAAIASLEAGDSVAALKSLQDGLADFNKNEA